MKEFIIIIFGGRNSKFIRFINFINRLFVNIIKTLRFVKKDRLIFYKKMISGFYFQDFQPSVKNEAEFYNKRFTFNYHDWFYVNFNVWRGILKPLKKITYLEIGSFEGRSAVFIGNLENAIEITAVDTFRGSMEFDRDMKEIDFNTVYNNCYQNLKKIDVVTREEFDVQKEVLLKTRKKLDDLEEKLNK